MVLQVDDIISPSYQDVIEDIMCDERMPWFYQEHMDSYEYSIPNFAIDIFNMDNNEGGESTQSNIQYPILYYALFGLAYSIVDKVIPGYDYHRIRGVLQTSIVNSSNYYKPHVDYSDPGEISVLYYPHDTTGKTYFFEETYSEDINVGEYDWNPIDSVEPKKGRIVVFPSNQYHAGSSPESGRRMLINFNYFNKNSLDDDEYNNFRMEQLSINT